MRRRATLALLASTLAGAAGCTATPGDDGGPSPSTSTLTSTPTPTGTGAPTDARSATPTDGPTPSGTPPAGVTPGPGSCDPERPTPGGTAAYDPPGYPAPPAEPTGDDARDYLARFEVSYHANRLVAEGAGPEGVVVADVTLDPSVVTHREGPDWTLAGVATDGSVGYAPAPAAATATGNGSDGGDGNAPASTSTATRTRTATRTPVPGITTHSRASYYLTDEYLVRQDRGHEGEPPAAVSGGTVVACFDD
jgi:hypothetical protein